MTPTRPPLPSHRRKLHRVVHHSEYRDHLPELLAAAEPHFVAFTSGLRDGEPWCRDCRAAMPVIRYGGTGVADVG